MSIIDGTSRRAPPGAYSTSSTLSSSSSSSYAAQSAAATARARINATAAPASASSAHPRTNANGILTSSGNPSSSSSRYYSSAHGDLSGGDAAIAAEYPLGGTRNSSVIPSSYPSSSATSFGSSSRGHTGGMMTATSAGGSVALPSASSFLYDGDLPPPPPLPIMPISSSSSSSSSSFTSAALSAAALANRLRPTSNSNNGGGVMASGRGTAGGPSQFEQPSYASSSSSSSASSSMRSTSASRARAAPVTNLNTNQNYDSNSAAYPTPSVNPRSVFLTGGGSGSGSVPSTSRTTSSIPSASASSSTSSSTAGNGLSAAASGFGFSTKLSSNINSILAKSGRVGAAATGTSATGMGVSGTGVGGNGQYTGSSAYSQPLASASTFTMPPPPPAEDYPYGPSASPSSRTFSTSSSSASSSSSSSSALSSSSKRAAAISSAYSPPPVAPPPRSSSLRAGTGNPSSSTSSYSSSSSNTAGVASRLNSLTLGSGSGGSSGGGGSISGRGILSSASASLSYGSDPYASASGSSRNPAGNGAVSGVGAQKIGAARYGSAYDPKSSTLPLSSFLTSSSSSSSYSSNPSSSTSSGGGAALKTAMYRASPDYDEYDASSAANENSQFGANGINGFNGGTAGLVGSRIGSASRVYAGQAAPVNYSNYNPSSYGGGSSYGGNSGSSSYSGNNSSTGGTGYSANSASRTSSRSASIGVSGSGGSSYPNYGGRAQALDLDQSRDSLLSNSDDGDTHDGKHAATQSPFSPFSPSAAVNDSRYDDDVAPASPQSQPQPVAANLSTRFSYCGAASSGGGGGGGKKIRALVGLQNLGNTCFLASCLQCLCSTPPLIAYFASQTHLQHLSARSPTKGQLAKSFGELIRALCTHGRDHDVVAPTDIKRLVGSYAPRFLGYNQQDSQEFLRFLLDGLHEDLNLVRQTPKYESIEDQPSDSAAVRSARWWANYTARNQSFIVDLFAGQLQSTLTCLTCEHRSIVYDPFWDLSLPLNAPSGATKASSSFFGGIMDRFSSSSSSSSSSGTVRLEDCFRYFTTPETLSGNDMPYCSRCKTHRESTKKMELYRFPEVLVVHLKRFSLGGTGSGRLGAKLNTIVEFPLEKLSLAEFSVADAISSSSSDCLYDLYAVSNHMGSLGGGHYTAHAKTGAGDAWCTFNDSRVSPVSSAHLGGSSAYVLFFHRRQ